MPDPRTESRAARYQEVSDDAFDRDFRRTKMGVLVIGAIVIACGLAYVVFLLHLINQGVHQ